MNSNKIKVLLVDDDPVLRRVLPHQLHRDIFTVTCVDSGTDALAALEAEEFDVVLLDVNLLDVSGLEILKTIRQTDQSPEVIMLTADESLDTGIESMRRGAYDYITKPYPPQALEAIVRKAADKRVLVQQNTRIRAAVRSQNQHSTREPVHASPAMKKILEQAEKVAQTDSTILLTGESGVGKDVIARWIHSKTSRADLPFVSVNCGAIPENLFESEFFGHEKGSFTGAMTQKIGLVEAADGSTLFLDEIGEMPLVMQVKLLHFLENKSFRRVGATRDRTSDARIIAATNRSLELDVRENKFRRDLYYRLNVVNLNLPPLRERKEDIAQLLEEFTLELRQRLNRPALRFDEKARLQVLNNEWHGNIRELRNTLERSAVFSSEDLVTEIYPTEPLTAKTISISSETEMDVCTLAEIEKKHILRILEQVGGKREKAAAMLGITARTLYRKLSDYENQT